jgi:hypothetical protein
VFSSFSAGGGSGVRRQLHTIVNNLLNQTPSQSSSLSSSSKGEEVKNGKIEKKTFEPKEKIVSSFFLSSPFSLVFRGHQTSCFFSRRRRRRLNHHHPSKRMADQCVCVCIGRRRRTQFLSSMNA